MALWEMEVAVEFSFAGRPRVMLTVLKYDLEAILHKKRLFGEGFGYEIFIRSPISSKLGILIDLMGAQLPLFFFKIDQ